jgi:hypothetical protein
VSRLMSPHFSKAVAVLLLLILVWLGLQVSFFLVTGRLRLSNETVELRQRLNELLNRRIDIPSLEHKLASLASSPSVQKAAIMADSGRAAFSRLQLFTRTTLEKAQGKLLALNERSMASEASIVAAQVRARMKEEHLRQWLFLLSNGEVHLRVEQLSIADRGIVSSGSGPELDISATIVMTWIQQDAVIR